MPWPRRAARARTVARLPTLAAAVADPATAWAEVTVARWYGRERRKVEVASATALWYHSGLPPVPLRWVRIRDPEGKFATQALLCTDQAATPEQILAWFILRWQLEVTLEEVRRHLGVAARWRAPRRQWSDLAIRRTTQRCSASSRSSPCWRMSAWPTPPKPPGRPRGTSRIGPPSPTRWRWSGASCGGGRLFTRPLAPMRSSKSRAPSPNAWPRCCATSLEPRKSS